MDLNVWLILTLICTASGTTPWRTGPPDKTDNSLSTIPETTADQTELVPFTAIVTDDTTPYSKVTTPSYGTEAHTSPQTTDNSLSTIPETTADQTELVTDKDDTTPYSKVTTPSYGTGAHTSPHTPVTTPSYLTELDTSTYTHTSVVTDSDDTTPYSKVTTPSYGTEAPISPQTPAWPPLTTQQPAQDENLTLVIGETQTIMSPNYPSNYPNDALYNWYITAISGYDVLFHFQNFYLQSNYDYLRIGTGDSATSPGSVEVVSLTGSSLPSDIRLFMLYKPNCWMKFTSNSLYTYQGFQLQLSIINSTSDEMLSLNFGDTKNTSSPNYPLNYDDNTEYTWYIAAPPGYDILVHFLDFYLESSYDYLLIWSGDSAASPGSIRLYTLTGSSLPSDRRINGPTGWMTLTSDSSVTYRGFELQLTLINSTVGGYCEECCECGDFIGCHCDSACQSRDDCCFDYTPHCSQVRLASMNIRYDGYVSGRVEVFTSESWGTVCNHNWDLKDGHVVCRSMGFQRASSVSYDLNFGPGTGDIHLDNVTCTGRESSILNCSHNGLGVHDCTHADDAGVQCSTNSAGYCQGCCDCGFIESGTCFCDVSCQELNDCCLDYESFCSEVNLRNGSNYIEGRVEVFADGIWGTVCDDFWDINDAKVVCKSMGFPGVEGAFSGAAFGEGTGNITLDNVNCTGEESSIFSCPSNGLGDHDCSHADDAGVRCSLSNDENVALISGETQTLNTPNYPDNYYDNTVYNWLITAPSGFHVLIRFSYMNLPICGDLVTIGTGDSPTSSDSVQLASLSGYRNPSDIRLYTPNGWIQFTSDDYVYVINSRFELELSSVDSTAAPARLVNGSYPNEGRVEVYSNSLETWGTICDYGWDTMDATVICRGLGYPDAVSSYGSALFGMGSGPILLNDVDCDGDEDNIFYCPYESGDIDYCTHFEDAGAMCYPNVRLVNGSSPSEGRVEVYHDGIWGTVCDYLWDSPESRVVCRSLGFPDELASFPNAYFGEGIVPSILRVQYCKGDENNIFDCCHYGIPYGCGHEDDVSVRCQPNVRLVNGGSSNEGRVEVYYGDTWGTVCDNEWGMDEARVICKSLGYPDALQAFGNASFGQGTGEILLDEVDCIGNESSIFYCYHVGVGVTSCSHQDDAGVRCSTGVTTPSSLTEFDTSTYTHTSEWSPGTTIPPRKAALDCNFESDQCGWEQLTSDVFDWTRYNGSTYTPQTGPDVDHTLGTALGHYMYTEASWPQGPGDYAIMRSPEIVDLASTDINVCFTFWYHMFGNGIGTLSLYFTTSATSMHQNDLVWAKSGDQGNRWIEANIPVTDFISTSKAGYFAFEGRISNYTADMAIDDITLGPCSGENVTLVVGETQNITSPNYPSNYTNDAFYNWYITAPPGYYVLIHFLDFNTESCCDYLKIGTGDSPTSYNSVQLASLSGSSLPSDIRLMTPTSWMKFTSNSNTTDKGFQLEMSVYEAIEDETTAWTSITSLFYTVTSDPETTRDLEDETTASTTTNIPTTSESSIPLPIIGAVTLVSLLVVAIVIVICVCLVCRKKRRMHMEEGLLDDDVFQPDYIELSPTPKTKKKNVIHKNRVSRPVLLANIETHYDWLKADSEHRLMEEYDDIQAVGSIVRMDQATNAEVNKTKNRFNKILPFEHSRVKLMALKGKSETDYINANYIPGFNSPREYIACQGPLPETANDMWRMIWEKKSTIIVMMTKTVEGGKDKCHQYWPKKKGRSDTYGGSLEVSLQSELDYEHWITRTFMLQKNKMKREVIQLQFTSWPDHGVPEQTKPMLDFVKNVRERIRNKCVIKPVIVHCSAGVGRTGTYIALDRLTQHMEDNDFVDVCGVVCEMRMHRNYLVQTETQYIFIHDCLMDYFCSGVAP